MADSVRLVANMNKFDSAQCWLSSLCWDGQSRIETFLVDYFSTEKSDYSHAVSLYLWTALAGRVLHPGCQVDMVPILFGDQGAGKSTGIAAMLPDQNYYCEIDLGERDNDLLRLMRGKLIGEISELRGLNTKDAGSIKAFLTRKTEQWTPKYQEYATSYERRIVFVGTTNEQHFLADETGNRRFLPIEVGKVHRDAIKRDCHQLWAEAAVRYKQAGILWQQAELLAKAEHDQYRMIEPWEDTIAQGLNGQSKAMSTTDILTCFLDMPASRIDILAERKVARIMKSLGYSHLQRRWEGGDRSYRWYKS